MLFFAQQLCSLQLLWTQPEAFGLGKLTGRMFFEVRGAILNTLVVLDFNSIFARILNFFFQALKLRNIVGFHKNSDISD